MRDFEHPILSQGRYRLIALTPGPDDACEAATSYAIATLGGDRLRVEATLPQARAWLQEQLRRDALAKPPPIRPRR